MSYPNLARLFRRVTLAEQATPAVCRICGAIVVYDMRRNHYKFHELVNGIDETLNETVRGNVQPTLPPF